MTSTLSKMKICDYYRWICRQIKPISLVNVLQSEALPRATMWHTHAYSCTDTHTHTHILSLTHSHTHTHTHTHTYTLTQTPSHTLFLSLSHSHTYSLTLMHAHTLSHDTWIKSLLIHAHIQYLKYTMKSLHITDMLFQLISLQSSPLSCNMSREA